MLYDIFLLNIISKNQENFSSLLLHCLFSSKEVFQHERMLNYGLDCSLYHTIGGAWNQNQSAWSKPVQRSWYILTACLTFSLVQNLLPCLHMLWSYSNAWQTGLFGVCVWRKSWLTAEQLCSCSVSSTTRLIQRFLFPCNLKKDGKSLLSWKLYSSYINL